MSVVPSLWWCLAAVTSRAATKHVGFIKWLAALFPPYFSVLTLWQVPRSVASSNVMFVKKENPRLLQLENAI